MANPREKKTGKGAVVGSIRFSPVPGPPQDDPPDQLTRKDGDAEPSPGRQQRAQQAGEDDQRQRGVHRLCYTGSARLPKLWPAGAVVLSGGLTVFRWMVFFVMILAGILAFVTWVMGVPIPGLSQFGIQQPTSPFGP